MILVGKIIDPYSIEKLLKIVGFMSLFWICTTLIVAPSSGEGIYYAMIGGQEAAYAVNESIK